MGRLRTKRVELAPAGAFARTGFLVDSRQREREVEEDERAAERRRILNILVVEYSYDELQVIAANMRREMGRRSEVEDMFAALSGYQLYETTCFLYSLKSRDRARFAADRRRSSPVLHREFRARQNEWRRNQPPDAKARDKRLKAAWAKANAARLNQRKRERRERMKAERPAEYTETCKRQRARRKARPGYAENRRRAEARHLERVKADPARYKRLRERKRKNKRAWYERNAEHAKEQERARRRGPEAEQLRARDRARYQQHRIERRAAAREAREKNAEDARRKRREWYRRNIERERERARLAQGAPEMRQKKRLYDRERYIARKAA